ncbi:RNA methyltransferase [Myxococcota bacterium]|nr:RNA methyltransferase [Myxococcota bacterium]MBU1380773.1 RNA methyltransferase [Myxococcota bacterium]MBU1498907.1 RNA methyltransferase [Myxococcota bacterium]
MDLKEKASHTHVLLMHYPVLNRNGETVTTAVTNLDIHDISRACRTYGIGNYFIVTPIKLQRELVENVIEHWTRGWGASYNERRAQAFDTTAVAPNIADCLAKIREIENDEPLIVATSARSLSNAPMMTYEEAVLDKRPLVLMFGTGWGMAPELMNMARAVLPPIKGPSEYNHLSVRSAVSIVLDRLFGVR